MLPTSRRDRYDNAKGRRGGILKTLLRKEGRLIRQLIVLLLFATVALFAFRWLANTNALASSTADDTASALHSESSSTTNKLSDTEVVKEAEAQPVPSVEAIPRVAFGGKRFLPLVEEEEGFGEERVAQLEGDKSGGKARSQKGDAGREDGGKGDLVAKGEAEKEGSEGEESGDVQGSVLTAEVLALVEDPDDGPWTKPAEEKGSGKPRKEAKMEQLADILHELDEAPKKEEKVHKERTEERSGDGEKPKEGLRGRKVEAGKESKERSAVEVQESSDSIAKDDEDQDGTRISDTGGLIRREAEGGGAGAARNGGGELEEDAGLRWKRDENAGDALVRVIKSPSKEDQPNIGAGKKEEPAGKVIKSPSKGAGAHSAEWEKRRQLVAAAFEDSWGAYRKHAWGHDELRPESRQGEDGLGGLGATIVDALDTAMIMGLGDIVSDAGNWIDRELPGRLAGQGYVNLFETTIRVLGGLLSAYHLSGGGGADLALAGGAVRAQGRGPPPEVYLKRAEDLGERLMSAFSSPTAVPFSDVHLANKEGKPAQFDGGSSSTAEVATLGMEFCYLSKLTGNPRYCDAALGVVKHIQKQHSVDGLVPIFINPHSGHFDGNNIRLGSRGDSYYEYLIKVWMQRGGAEAGKDSDVRWLREMWDESMAGVKGRLLGSSVPSGLLFVGERPDGLRAELSPKMDHLVCFLAGALALGATKGRTVEEAMSAGDFSDVDKEDLRVAQELTRTCYAMYDVTITGLAPEIAYFNIGGGVNGMPPGNPKSKYLEDIVIQPLDRHNLLRPETVESLFVLYRITGDEQYREWGWDIFKSLEAHAKVATGGYSSLHDVTKIPAPKRDKMETFFLGETLKYLYLLFSDSDVLPLDRYVFNTEAHPLPVWEADVEKSSRHTDSKHEPTTER